ncbi:PREDICTED: uncharacterized protein LOC108562547 [Nicrophorus vespilloides]|uniref:Uncharacterized protein LOC108562547 n=1 Tax=Nicrophorus vespilloides TaxID=110193 RepID=A0ABM1MPB9_NICVS|nr:PREDICTED: uncharacterized protein LOC108562547 [Nicrophorus vespilloides]
MPDVMRQDPTLDIDLRLQGDKIRLESRPSSRGSSASSKSAYLVQGPSRPLSAVPNLTLYEDKRDYETIRSHRPYSADNARECENKLSSNSSLESISEIDKDLPSTELLRSLISEPIVSWRDGMKHVHRIKNTKPSSSDLQPGLKSKPPIPPKKVTLEEYNGQEPSKYHNWLDESLIAEQRTDAILDKLKLENIEGIIDYYEDESIVSKNSPKYSTGFTVKFNTGGIDYSKTLRTTKNH